MYTPFKTHYNATMAHSLKMWIDAQAGSPVFCQGSSGSSAQATSACQLAWHLVVVVPGSAKTEQACTYTDDKSCNHNDLSTYDPT